MDIKILEAKLKHAEGIQIKNHSQLEQLQSDMKINQGIILAYRHLLVEMKPKKKKKKGK